MTINKYTGKTEEEAKEKARKELGSAAVIMNIKEIKPKGLGGLFKSPTYEVTAAIEDDHVSKETQAFAESKPKNSGFEAVADESLDDTLPLLKDAFSAVNSVLDKQTKEAPVNTFNTKEPQMTEQPIYERPKMQKPAGFEPLSDQVPHAKIIDPSVKEKEPEIIVNREPDILQEKPVERKKPSLIEEDLKPDTGKPSIDNENHVFVKMLYNVLLENEVSERYINLCLEDMDKVLQSSHSLDNLLSNVYQKMVLKLGTPSTIKTGDRRPKVVFFVGPTGVGKTTTIAKIASKFKVEEGKKVGLITADTYRMAAANQLQTYANILGVPLNVVYSADELLDTVKKQTRENDELDVILVDTIGFSHKNEEQRLDTKKLLNSLGDFFETEVYLVLSATTKYKDLIEISDSYKEFCDYSIIFTKLDETKCYGNIFNIKLHSKQPLSYVTLGQNVPDDIEILNAQKLVKLLLGGN